LKPKFSIIIAAKNEEKNIHPLLDSIAALNYPKDYFELIIVDDLSEDHTMDVIKQFNRVDINLKASSSEGKQFKGKKGALDIGIKEAKHDFIIITDADCRPLTDWLNFYSTYFEKGYDFLYGPAPFYQDKSNWVNELSCFENLRSSLLCAFFTNSGLPYSASARNFGFRKSAFHEAEGYTNTTETLGGDDDLLIREAVKRKLTIGFINNPNAAVYSFTKTNFKDYLRQKKRHTKTSLYYLPVHQLFLGTWHLMNLLLLFSPFFPIKLILDVFVVKKNLKTYNYRFSTIKIILFQILYEIFIIINFINALFGKDEWK